MRKSIKVRKNRRPRHNNSKNYTKETRDYMNSTKDYRTQMTIRMAISKMS